MKKFVYCAILCFLFIFFACANIASAQVPSPSYIPGQVIVNFNKGYSPDELEKTIAQKQSLRKSFIGSAQLFIERLMDVINPKVTPGDNLEHIQAVEKKVQVISVSRMFDGIDESETNTYLYVINDTQDVQSAVKAFESLSEVKYAQPNFIYEINDIK